MLLDGRLIAIDPSPLKNFGRAYCACDNSTSSEPTDTFRREIETSMSAVDPISDHQTGLVVVGDLLEPPGPRLRFVTAAACRERRLSASQRCPEARASYKCDYTAAGAPARSTLPRPQFYGVKLPPDLVAQAMPLRVALQRLQQPIYWRRHHR
jgi:hypothetical protein